MGDARGIINTQFHKRQDTQVGVEQLTILKRNALFGAQQGIDLLQKIGIDMQEGIVEYQIELAALLLDEFTGFRELIQLIDLTG